MALRKFYNTGVAEGGGGSETAVAEAPAMSIAGAMAKHGVNAGSENQVAKPIDITKKEEVKTEVEKPTPAATATVEKPTEEKPDSETSQATPAKEEPKPAATPPIAVKPAEKVTTW